MLCLPSLEERVEQGGADWFGPSNGLTALEMLVSTAAAAGEGVVWDACNQLDDEGNSPLHLLVQAGFFGHPAALTLLLQAGASPNVQSTPNESEYTSGQWGRTTATGEKEVLVAAPDRTLLHAALDTDERSDAMVKLLLEHHADPNVRDSEQRSALHIALDFEDDRGGIDLEMCELLLKHRADPSLGSHEIGMTNSCLHAAAINKDYEVVRLLLRHGAPHSAPGKGGWTPIAIAARGGASAIVAELLAAGADPDVPTPCGKSLRELAVINKKDGVIEVLDRASPNPKPNAAAINKKDEMIKALDKASAAHADRATAAHADMVAAGAATTVEEAATTASAAGTGKHAAKNRKRREKAKQKRREQSDVEIG